MKTKHLILGIATILNLSVAGVTSAGGKHDHHVEKAPHKGRLMETQKLGAMHLEFVIEADRNVSVYLYDGKLKPVTPSDQAVSLIVQGKGDTKNKVELAKKEDRFVSSAPIEIPEGAKAVLTIKAGDKVENLRFALDLSICGGCKGPEYACACGH